MTLADQSGMPNKRSYSLLRDSDAFKINVTRLFYNSRVKAAHLDFRDET